MAASTPDLLPPAGCEACPHNPGAEPSPALRILIPGEPHPKERPQVNHKTMTVYTPKQTKVAEEAAAWGMRGVMRSRPPLTGDLEASILCAHEGAGTKGDWDNFGKLVSDAGNKVVWQDDRQLTLVTVELRRYDPRPRTLVVVRRRSRPRPTRVSYGEAPPDPQGGTP